MEYPSREEFYYDACMALERKLNSSEYGALNDLQAEYAHEVHMYRYTKKLVKELDAKDEAIKSLQTTIHNYGMYRVRLDRLMTTIAAERVELAKAHKLIEDIVAWANSDADMKTEDFRDIVKLLDEAEAMMGGSHEKSRGT